MYRNLIPRVQPGLSPTRARITKNIRWKAAAFMWAITMALAVAGAVGATALPSVAQTAPIVLEQLGDRSVFTTASS